MLSVLFPILYFVSLFGFFEIVMFRRGIAYWWHPVITASYFIVAASGALFFFSAEPLHLFLESAERETGAMLSLFVILTVAIYRGHFTYHEASSYSFRNRQLESFRYVCAKSADLFFQDILAVLVILALHSYIGTIDMTVLLFATYFSLAHLLLFVALPARFALIFFIASIFAGLAFAYIVLYGVGVIYVFILHWLFYVATYSRIKTVRQQVLPELRM